MFDLNQIELVDRLLIFNIGSANFSKLNLLADLDFGLGSS